MSRRSDLSVPKSGTSRFSKALPTVPGFDDFDFDDDGDDDDDDDLDDGGHSLSNAIDRSIRNRSRNDSEYSLPARTSSLASPPPTRNLPLPPLRLALPTKTLPTKTLPPPPPQQQQQQPDRGSKNSTGDSAAGQTSIAAPSPAPGSTPSWPGMLSLQSPPTSGPPMMSIPRKPIANLRLPSPSLQHLAQPSPTFSLSSLLSAYMGDGGDDGDGDGDEPQRASLYEPATSASETESPAAAPASAAAIATAAAAAAAASAAASAAAAVAAASVTAAAAAATAPSKPEAPAGGSGSLPALPALPARPADRNLPPPPPKDGEAQKLKPSTPGSAAAPSATTSELPTPPSPRPEIWKRRPHTSQASRELPGLKLDFSHGSTADTQLPPHPPSEATKATAQRAPPFPGGLPGRNIRPSLPAKDQARGQAPPPATQTMGSETSRLKQIKGRLGSQRSESASSTSSAKAGIPGAPAAQRPPTPEYQKEDVKQPLVEPFISPVSPASSPEAPRGASPDFSKDLPPKPPKDGQAAAAAGAQKPIPRKALPTAPSQDLATAENPSRPPSDANSAGIGASGQAAAAPPASGDDVARAPAASSPNETASAGSRVSGGTAAVQPQPAAAQANAPQTVRPQRRAPQATSDPRLVRTQSQGLLYRGRDGTLYADMRTDGEPHPKATYFPTQTYPSLPRDGIIKAMPLTGTHFDCFHQHRTMNRRSNRNCPLTCQTCERADLEDRWVCTFCHLRICDACHRRLGSYQRDLRRLVDGLANSGPPGLASQSRPGTAPGLRTAF
ncbi:hypothetical protein Trco_000395 [Trichoderma cornu-damae]|uniref:Uncharacterized protein n=1 Tax=Trichoderma cornu-damae TaxID=654480 RepID=A0A9P8QRV8_9HYPO|nr:hypothetical protein Trco_000395 [Trichoderma cornu-damae]